LILFLVTPPVLHWQWLAFHLFKQDTWISPSIFFQKHLMTRQFFTPSYSTPSKPSHDIASPEAYCIPKTKPSNQKILFDGLLCTS